MPASAGHALANSSDGDIAVIRVTMRPMKTGMRLSSRATQKPAANSAMNTPLA